MTNYPVKVGKRAIRKVAKDAVKLIEPAATGGPFFSFRYSCTEISALGGKAHVKSRKTRFEDGKLSSEAFEGDLDRSAYEQAVRQVQQAAIEHTALLLNSIALLPFFPRRRPDRD
jgi:hypothetical protein